MRSRPAPALPAFMRPEYARHSRIQAAIETLASSDLGLAATKTLLAPFSLQEREYIRYMTKLRRRGPFDQKLYMQAFRDTAQVVAMPRVTDLHFDAFAALCQPEMVAALADWEVTRGRRGAEANTTFAQALMTMLVFEPGTHVKGTYLNLQQQPQMLQLFARIEQLVAAYAGRPARSFLAREYTTVLDQITALSASAHTLDGFAYRLMRANVETVRALAELFPGAGIGCVGVVDGTDIAAWSPQDAEGSPRTPRAALKVIEYGRGGKRDITNDPEAASSRAGFAKVWNGYYLVALVELKTGLPLVWTLRSANHDEAPALKELLFLLYELWPDCPLETVVGDAAWDEADWVELCELNYGIHPVFRRSDAHANPEHLLKGGRSKWNDTRASACSDTLAGYSGRGIPFCRAHGAQLSFAGGTWGNRSGLQPGDAADPAGFRVRFDCPDGCGRPGLPTGIDWDAFPYWPHHSHGQPDRYAMRLALENRRNIVECAFASLKTVSQLGLRGAARTRLTDFDTVRTLISLAFTIRSSLLLADQRIQRGLFPAQVPADFSVLMPPARQQQLQQQRAA